MEGTDGACTGRLCEMTLTTLIVDRLKHVNKWTGRTCTPLNSQSPCTPLNSQSCPPRPFLFPPSSSPPPPPSSLPPPGQARRKSASPAGVGVDSDDGDKDRVGRIRRRWGEFGARVARVGTCGVPLVPRVVGRQKYFCQPQLAVTGDFRQPCKKLGWQKIGGLAGHRAGGAGKNIVASPPLRHHVGAEKIATSTSRSFSVAESDGKSGR